MFDPQHSYPKCPQSQVTHTGNEDVSRRLAETFLMDLGEEWVADRGFDATAVQRRQWRPANSDVVSSSSIAAG